MPVPETLLPDLLAALAATRKAAPRARERVLDESDLRALVEALAAAQPEADDVLLRGVVYGGFVPNGYRYRAEADVARVTVDLATGVTDVRVTRTDAPRRSHGRGSSLLVRLVRAGQTDGRIVN